MLSNHCLPTPDHKQTISIDQPVSSSVSRKMVGWDLHGLFLHYPSLHIEFQDVVEQLDLHVFSAQKLVVLLQHLPQLQSLDAKPSQLADHLGIVLVRFLWAPVYKSKFTVYETTHEPLDHELDLGITLEDPTTPLPRNYVLVVVQNLSRGEPHVCFMNLPVNTVFLELLTVLREVAVVHCVDGNDHVAPGSIPFGHRDVGKGFGVSLVIAEPPKALDDDSLVVIKWGTQQSCYNQLWEDAEHDLLLDCAVSQNSTPQPLVGKIHHQFHVLILNWDLNYIDVTELDILGPVVFVSAVYAPEDDLLFLLLTGKECVPLEVRDKAPEFFQSNSIVFVLTLHHQEGQGTVVNEELLRQSSEEHMGQNSMCSRPCDPHVDVLIFVQGLDFRQGGHSRLQHLWDGLAPEPLRHNFFEV